MTLGKLLDLSEPVSLSGKWDVTPPSLDSSEINSRGAPFSLPSALS